MPHGSSLRIRSRALDAEPRVEEALRSAALEPVLPLSVVLAGYYLIVMLGRIFLMGPPEGFILAALAGLTTLAFIVIAVMRGLDRIPLERAHAVVGGAALLVLLNASMQLALVRTPEEATHIMLTVIGGGLVLLSTRWFATLAALAFVAWLAVALSTPPWMEWQQNAFTVLAAGVLGVVAHVMRRTSSIRDERGRMDQQRQSQSLQAAYRELEAFSHTVSHDLRAPARATSQLAQILLEEKAGTLDAEAVELLRRIRAESERMRDLIDDVLALSVASGKEVEREEVDVASLAEEVAQRMRERFPERNVEFHAQPGIRVLADPRLLSLGLSNLLENAWKYTRQREQARIEVGLSGATRDGLVEFFVRDNGVGFSPERAEEAFLPFRRLHASSQFGGSGVGLATVRRAVTRMGGRVRAEARDGEGATFFVALPAPEHPSSSTATATGAQTRARAGRGVD